MFFAVVVAMGIIGVAVKPMVGMFATEQSGFFIVACILGACSTLLLITSFFLTEERVSPPKENYKFKDMFPIVLKNDALLVLAIAMLLNTGVWVTGNAVALYYFKYILGKPELQSTFFMVMIPANLIGAFVTPKITAIIGKKKTFMIGSLLVAVFSFSRHFISDTSIVMIFAFSALSSISMMFCSITQWGMLPDTVEYGHWKTGKRSEGLPFAFFSFMQKTSMALTGSMAAYVMSTTGYVANEELTTLAEQGIRWLFNIAPGVYSIICFFVLIFYKIDGKLFTKIMDDLNSNKLSSSES
jgi:Na+/melibiose symporter-like transporter